MRVVAQRGEGLAAGLTSVFARFAQGSQKPHYCLQQRQSTFTSAILEDAFEALTTHDIVVGPTYDGGYYLVGAKASHPALFTDDGMGTGSALEQLLGRTRVLELSVSCVDPFYDIDVAEDLIRLAAELERAPDRAPRTAVWLETGERHSAGCGRAQKTCEVHSIPQDLRPGYDSARIAVLLFPQFQPDRQSILPCSCGSSEHCLPPRHS